MQKLIEGLHHFQSSIFSTQRELFERLARGQNPETLFITCSDSRINPNLLTQTEPGDLFILRNVANLVPPYEPEGKYHGTSAGIEFAVQGLKVPHLIILGHSRCGGVAAYRHRVRDKVAERGFIGSWLTMLDDLKIDESEIFEFGDETAFEFASIRSSLANLRTFPFIKKREEEGLLSLHGLHFDLASGTLLSLDNDRGSFTDLHAA